MASSSSGSKVKEVQQQVDDVKAVMCAAAVNDGHHARRAHRLRSAADALDAPMQFTLTGLILTIPILTAACWQARER